MAAIRCCTVGFVLPWMKCGECDCRGCSPAADAWATPAPLLRHAARPCSCSGPAHAAPVRPAAPVRCWLRCYAVKIAVPGQGDHPPQFPPLPQAPSPLSGPPGSSVMPMRERGTPGGVIPLPALSAAVLFSLSGLLGRPPPAPPCAVGDFGKHTVAAAALVQPRGVRSSRGRAAAGQCPLPPAPVRHSPPGAAPGRRHPGYSSLNARRN